MIRLIRVLAARVFWTLRRWATRPSFHARLRYVRWVNWLKRRGPTGNVQVVDEIEDWPDDWPKD